MRKKKKKELIFRLPSGALVTCCCQNTFALMTNLKMRTRASHVIRELKGRRRARDGSGGLERGGGAV